MFDAGYTLPRRLYLSTAVDSKSNFLDRRGTRREVRQEERDRERGGGRNGRGNKRKRTGMPSHRGLSSPTKEDYRICLLVDRHRCCPFFSLSLSTSSASCRSFIPTLPVFISGTKRNGHFARGTKFRRKFLRKSHCHLSRSLIRRTYRSSRRDSTRETIARSLIPPPFLALSPSLSSSRPFVRQRTNVFITALER